MTSHIQTDEQRPATAAGDGGGALPGRTGDEERSGFRDCRGTWHPTPGGTPC